MIQIKHKKLDSISLAYYRSIDKRIKKRILDIDNILEAIDGVNGKTVNNFSALTANKWKGVKKLLNSLPGVNISSQSDLSKWVIPPDLKTNRPFIDSILSHLRKKKNRKLILLSQAKDHEQLIKDHYAKMNITPLNEEAIAPFMKRVLDYKLITKKIAYNLTWGLGIRTCPYCNRIWIDTVLNKTSGVLRPALDHFYSQKNYPLMGLSFYNLVPSCTNCNSSLKSAKDFTASTHVHPYIEGFDRDAVFSFTFNGVKKDLSHPDNFILKISPDKNIDADKKTRIFGNKNKDVGSIPTFKLDIIYQVHKDLLGELYVKSEKNSSFYLTSLKEFLVNLKTSKEEFYRYHFHNYYEDENMNMRPLSKFTRDIILERVPELR